jgi:DNA-nicking Smr family endonuclease
MGKQDDKDAAAFRDAMRDVKPIREPVVVPPAPKPPPRARFKRADERDVLRESLEAAPDETLTTGEELSFRRPHVPESVLLKLRRGHYVVDAEIDLHGMTGAQAKAALREFLADAVDRHLSCVRVVHGKGNRSGPRGPVLKNVVNQWLQRSDRVLAFGSARAVDGGSGAAYVLLNSK